MYFFIAIILIAELIIAANLIWLMLKLDKKVLEADQKVREIRPELKQGLKAAKNAVAKFVEGVHSLCRFAEKKKKEYTISIVKTILIYLLLFLLKGKRKKCLSVMQLAVVLKDCWDKGTACNS